MGVQAGVISSVGDLQTTRDLALDSIKVSSLTGHSLFSLAYGKQRCFSHTPATARYLPTAAGAMVSINPSWTGPSKLSANTNLFPSCVDHL